MRTIVKYQENCALCAHIESINQFHDYYEGEVKTEDDGFEFLVPTFVENKRQAKTYFKWNGWKYYKKQIFCGDCFSKLEIGYLVMDCYNQFYTEEGISNTLRFSSILDKEEALEMVRKSYNGEQVYLKKALSIACQYYNGEILDLSVDYVREHPEVKVNLRLG